MMHEHRMPRLTICMLAACPFPANHGTPGSIREMAEAVSAEGHDVHVVTYHFGEDIAIRGPRLHRIPRLTTESAVIVGPTARRPLYDLQMVFKTLQVIRRHHPDVLHAHGYEAALVAGCCRLLTGIPVLYSGHNTMADELPSYQCIRPQWLAKGLAKALDTFVPHIGHRCLPHSTNIDRFFAQRGLRHRTEPVVNFGIDLDWVAQGNGHDIRQRYDLGASPVILYTGVMDQFQRLDLLLEAVALVLHQGGGAGAGPRGARAKLLIVVTIPQTAHLARIRRHAEQLGIADQVVLTEPQPLTAVRDFLHACDVAVVPRPQAPGFPIKLLNYLAAKRPCVLFASSSSQGLIHRENVYLAAPDSSAALADGLSALLKDPVLRQRLGENGHCFVRQHHDRRIIAHRVCAAYRRTVAAAHGQEPRHGHQDVSIGSQEPAIEGPVSRMVAGIA